MTATTRMTTFVGARALAITITAGALAAAALPTASRAALARPLAPVVDVTAESGGRVDGEVTAWRTPDRAEHLAGRDAGGNLLAFTWTSAAGRWSVQNISSATGRRVSGGVVAWQTSNDPYNVEHLATRGVDGHLRVFYRSTRNSTWRTVDVTAKTGRRVVDVSAAWQARNGSHNVEHLAARDAAGHVLVFWWSPARDWQVVDVTAKTGGGVASSLTGWQLRRGGVNTEYLAGTAADGTIKVFSWAPGRDWRAEAAPPQRLVGGVISWLTGTVQHLAGARADGTLLVLWRNGGTAWNAVDVSAMSGERVVGPPTVHQLRDGAENVEVLGSRNAQGGLIEHWWKPSRDWQGLSLSDITGRSIASAPASWLSSSSGRTVEHYAATGTDGHLRVFYSFDQPRMLTDRIGGEVESIKRTRNTTRKVLAVLWDPHDPLVSSRASAAAIGDTLFGPGGSVRRYFSENSGSKFTIANAGVHGWYEADHPLSYYDDPQNPHDKMGAALRAADTDVDFRSYDTNADRELEPHELGLVFIHPGTRPGGLLRAGGNRRIQDPDGGDLRLDGVRIQVGSEIAIGNPPNLGVVAHELSHLLFGLPGLPDMYFTFFTPTAAGSYSLMDNTYARFHIDPANKLKLGWAQPRLIFRGARYTMPDVETRHRVLALVDATRGTDEYFLVENRFPGASFDAGLPDSGLGVWHVMEKRATYDAAPPPATVSMSDWAAMGSGGWGRSGIRMVRPRLERPFDDRTALWGLDDGDLLSTSSDPTRPALRWGDGSASGFALRSIGPAGPNVGVIVDVPAARAGAGSHARPVSSSRPPGAAGRPLTVPRARAPLVDGASKRSPNSRRNRGVDPT